MSTIGELGSFLARESAAASVPETVVPATVIPMQSLDTPQAQEAQANGEPLPAPR
jgi:hypothetical protein